MELEVLQRHIKNMLKGNPALVPCPTHPYLNQVANAPGLEILQEIALWWRAFQIEQFCVFTSGYLRLTGCFDAHIRGFYADTNVSAFIEEAGLSFLEYMAHNTDKTIAALAKLEYALIQAKKGDQRETIIAWPCNPLLLLHGIMAQQDLSAALGSDACYTRVGPDIPHLFEVMATPQ